MELLLRKIHKHIFNYYLNPTQSTKTKMYSLKGVTMIKIMNFIA